MSNVCIYHGNCADGFGAAWVVRAYFGDDNVLMVPGVYQNPPPDVAGKDVLMVDFSYKRPVVEAMLEHCNSMLIIDHHKTAVEDLEPLKDHPKLKCVFDIQHSGAMLTWRHFFPEREPPLLLWHIEDRDLWKFEMPGTRSIQANLFSYPYDFKTWDRLMAMNSDELQNQFRVEGDAIERKHLKDVNELINVVTRDFEIGGYIVPVANLPYTLVSDAATKLAAAKPFAACYWDTPDGRVFGLRSDNNGVDVSRIAKEYGGGGHKHAAGFRVGYDHPLVKKMCS